MTQYLHFNYELKDKPEGLLADALSWCHDKGLLEDLMAIGVHPSWSGSQDAYEGFPIVTVPGILGCEVLLYVNELPTAAIGRGEPTERESALLTVEFSKPKRRGRPKEGVQCPTCSSVVNPTQLGHWIGWRLGIAPPYWKELITLVIARDKGQCQECGGRGATVRHVIPPEEGGTDSTQNLKTLCEKCRRVVLMAALG